MFIVDIAHGPISNYRITSRFSANTCARTKRATACWMSSHSTAKRSLRHSKRAFKNKRKQRKKERTVLRSVCWEKPCVWNISQVNEHRRISFGTRCCCVLRFIILSYFVSRFPGDARASSHDLTVCSHMEHSQLKSEIKTEKLMVFPLPIF